MSDLSQFKKVNKAITYSGTGGGSEVSPQEIQHQGADFINVSLSSGTYVRISNGNFVGQKITIFVSANGSTRVVYLNTSFRQIGENFTGDFTWNGSNWAPLYDAT
jgi:hypothetical protein